MAIGALLVVRDLIALSFVFTDRDWWRLWISVGWLVSGIGMVIKGRRMLHTSPPSRRQPQ